MSGFDAKITPLIPFFESLGYTADSSNGRTVIRNYVSTEDELNSLYDGVGLRDISDSGILELKGKDVLDYLHRISTNSLMNLQKEKVVRTILTTEKGRLIDIPYIINFDTQQLFICSGYHKHKVKSWLNKYIIVDDVALTDTGDKYVLLELLGPQADSFAMLVSGSIADSLEPEKFKVVNSEGMLFFLVKLKEKTNRNRYWFISDQENGKLLINYMLNNKGSFDFNLIGEEAYDNYRIEQGIAIAPNEINDNYNPHEIKMMDLVDTKKGCYIGQEVIARLETYDKVQRELTGLRINGEKIEPGIELVDDQGAEAGKITSTVYSAKCKCSIALAYIKKAYSEDGKELLIKESNIKAAVKTLPFRK
jgi:tRNA-modifying protein YgfZ